MIRQLFNVLLDFSEKMKKQNISTFAASTAFFFFLSIVPMLIMVCTIIPYTPLTEENLVEAVTDLTPDQVDGLAESLISDIYDNSAGVLSIALIATIWSASKGVMALMRGLNAINGVEEKRNYFVVRVSRSLTRKPGQGSKQEDRRRADRKEGYHGEGQRAGTAYF